MEKSKVLFDSSVLIAATLSARGGSFYILTQLSEQYQFIINEYILEETLRILHEKFDDEPRFLKTFFFLLAKGAIQTLKNPSKQKLSTVKRIIEVSDGPILVTALEEADYLITLDKDFSTITVLNVAQRQQLHILRPEAFIHLTRLTKKS